MCSWRIPAALRCASCRRCPRRRPRDLRGVGTRSTDEPIPEGSLSQVPAWALPGLFADALANPDPRWWVALVTGRDSPFAVTLVRDYVLRRLVMARHLEAARNGVHVALADNEVILDLGLDIAPLVGAFAALSTVVDEVDGDAPRSTDRR